jgi:hypothetical protein
VRSQLRPPRGQEFTQRTTRWIDEPQQLWGEVGYYERNVAALVDWRLQVSGQLVPRHRGFDGLAEPRCWVPRQCKCVLLHAGVTTTLI